MNNKKRWPWVLMWAAVLGFCGTAQATTYLYKDFDALVGDADAVISGTVTEIRYERGPNNLLYSFISLSPIEVISGSYPDSAITLRMTGGRDKDEVQQIDGAPEFQAGQEVILFVWGNGEYDIPMVGGPQGVFRVHREAKGGGRYVTDHGNRPVHGVKGPDLILDSAGVDSTDGSSRSIQESTPRGGLEIVGQPPGKAPDANPSQARPAGPVLDPAAFKSLVRQHSDELRGGKRKISRTSRTSRQRRSVVSIHDISQGTFRGDHRAVAPRE